MGWEGLAIFLNRWSSPCRDVDIQERFRRSEKELSEIGLYVLKFLYLRFGKHLQKPCFEILRNRASEYAEGVIRKGSPLRNCIGFIDGTLRSICRPMLCQELCYNGHKRKHCVKFQSLITPDGLFAQLYGPIEGRRHDLFLLHSSNLIDDMNREIPDSPHGIFLVQSKIFPLIKTFFC
jgi:hypothetical protein